MNFAKPLLPHAKDAKGAKEKQFPNLCALLVLRVRHFPLPL